MLTSAMSLTITATRRPSWSVFEAPWGHWGIPLTKNDPLLVVKHVLQQSGLASPQKATQHRDWQELCLSLVSLVNIHGYGRRTGTVALVSTHRSGAVVWR